MNYMTKEAVISLVSSYQASRSKPLLERLVANFENMCFKAVAAYSFRNDYQDLLQEARMALIESANSFDPARSGCFMNYAFMVIRNRVGMYAISNWGVIKVPDTSEVKKAFRRMGRYQHANTLTQSMAEELAIELAVSVSSVYAAYALYNQGGCSLDAPVSGGDDSTMVFHDLLAEERSDPLLKVEQDDLVGKARAKLDAFLSSLPDRSREIFCARKLADTPSTLNDLSEVHSVSKERVRHIEAAVARQLENFCVA